MSIARVLFVVAALWSMGLSQASAQTEVDPSDLGMIEVAADETGVIVDSGLYSADGEPLMMIPVVYVENGDGTFSAQAVAAERANTLDLEIGTLGLAVSYGVVIGRYDINGGIVGGSIEGILLKAGVGHQGAELGVGFGNVDPGAGAMLAAKGILLHGWGDGSFQGTYAGAALELNFFLMNLDLGAAYRITSEDGGKDFIIRVGAGLGAAW